MRLDFCVACGGQETLNHHHLVPKVYGGSNRDENLITLCRKCHGLLHQGKGELWSVDVGRLIRVGQARARANGVKFGRPAQMSKEQIAEALELRKSGETLLSIGRRYGLSESSVCRLFQRQGRIG